MTDPPEAGEAVHPSSAIDEAAVESWLESHPEFFEDYFYRKATRRLVDTWVYRRVRTATTTSSHGASFSSFDWHSIPETLAQQQNQQQQPAGGDSAIQEEIESSVNVSRSTSCSSNVIRKILRNVCLLIGADRCSLFLVESAPGRSQLELVSNLFDVTADSCLETILANHSSIRIPIGQGIVGSVALTGEPVRIADAYQDERFNAEIDKQTGYRTKSVLCLPVKDHTGAVIGVTQAVNKRDGGVFSETDEKTFETFLTFCGIGIRNAKLYKQSQLETKRNQVLLDMVRIISEQQDNLDPLVRKIMHYMQLITTCRWCQILLIDDPTSVEGMFDHAFELRFEDDDANSATVHDGESRQPAAPVVTDYCRMLLNSELISLVCDTGEELERLSISALLCLPIKNAQSRVAGLCLLMNKSDGGAFTSGDQQLAEAFALFCGLGIHNTRMFERAEVAKRRQQVALEVLSYHAVASSEDAQKLAKCLIPSSRFLGINEFSFSDLAMSDEETLISVIKMFEDTGLFSAFKLNYASFCRWILSVKKNYRAVTYHNWRHALNVTQCMFAMLRTSPELRGLNRLDKLALLVASICHDLDHRGTDNKFQRLTLSPLAQLYSRAPRVKKMYRRKFLNFCTQWTGPYTWCDQCIMLLSINGCDILSSLSQSQYERCIATIEKCILATDLQKHMAARKVLQQLVTDRAFNWSETAHQDLLLGLLMTAADLSAITKPWSVQKKVAFLVASEFYEQGDREKQELHLQPDDQKDRAKQQKLPKMQVDFIDFVCLPVYTLLCEICSELHELRNGCLSNRAQWESLTGQ
uniref:Phosphodiesterase n=1 Tax=Macrostomum lignano TaxID=282301 RepID=A0A1I8GIE2_9PLAT